MNAGLDYKSLFKAAPIARFIVRAANGGYALVDINTKANTYFGITDSQSVIGKDLGSFISPEVYGSFCQSLDEAVSKKKAVSIHSTVALPGTPALDGLLVNPFINDKGDVDFLDIAILGVNGDSASLQRERDDAISLLTSVFDVSEVGIVVTDRHYRIVRINDSFVRIYGWKRDDLIGREFLILITPDEREQARRNHEEFIKSGIRSSGEMKMLRKDGSIANALFTTAALELSHGRRFQVTTIMDISMRKQMEVTLRLAKEQADTANHAKSTFLANMSHELRTPLNAILGFSEMMMKETFGKLGNEKYKEYLGDIHLSARHLLEIINEVLDMSKIEAGKVELDEELFDIHGLIQAVVRMMDSRAFSSGLKIREHVQQDLPPLYADSRLVRQILINIVGNSVKYSKTGATIDISAFIADDGDLHLVVADTGIGIPADRIQVALEPFGQVSKSAESGGMQGTGLGLPLAKAMAELHGGSLILESELGKGTTVTVTLPSRRLGSKKDRSNVTSPIAAIGRNKGTVKTG